VRKWRDTFSRPAWGRWAIIGGLTVLLGSCAVTETQHGHLLPPNAAEELAQANISQTRVVDLLGTPSAVSAFDRNRWYYVSEIQQHTAFFKPDVVDREVLILEFDRSQRLQRVATLTEEDGREVTLVSRETPTEGNRITIIEQLLGNLGRFNQPAQ